MPAWGVESHINAALRTFDSEEAAEAGRRGGEVVSRDREHMAEIGREGGLAAHHRDAAFYHEQAAHHHRQAAHHHERGDMEESERHAELANGHSTTATRAQSEQPAGFAAMDPEERREIARKGGRASHRAHGSEEGEERRLERTARQGWPPEPQEFVREVCRHACGN